MSETPDFSTRKSIEEYSKANAQSITLPDNTGLCRVLGQYKMYVDILDDGISPHLMIDGFWESWVTKFIWNCIHQEDICIDIGANHGYYTMIMLHKTGQLGHTFVYEPHEDLCKLIHRSVNLQGFQNNVSISNSALSDNEGYVRLSYNRSNQLNSSIYYKVSNEDSHKEVKVSTIDTDLLSQKVDFVKIDAEGSEITIWYGMQKVIQTNLNHIKIVMEFAGDRYGNKIEQFVKDINHWFPQMYFINIEGYAQPITSEQILSSTFGNDIMLFLTRIPQESWDKSWIENI